jgi:hypothetical protein
VDLVVCAVGMLCVAVCCGTLQRCVCMGPGQNTVWFNAGKDAIWCSLVVQPFLGLVCRYAVGNDSGMLAKSYGLTCQILCLWVRACMQRPCNFDPLPNTTHPDSSPSFQTNVTVCE